MFLSPDLARNETAGSFSSAVTSSKGGRQGEWDDHANELNEAKSMTAGTDSSVSGSQRIQDDGTLSNQDSPQALVKRENRVVRVLRSVLMVALFVAAVGTAASVFFFARHAEQKTFRLEYEAISKFVLDSLMEDLGRFMWAGQAVSSTLTIAMTAYNVSATKLAISRSQWGELTGGLRAATGSPFLTWSPFLRNDVERAEFEAFVADLESSGYFSEGQHPKCYVCDTEDRGVLNPTDEVDFPR
jgi:hypothetical protein